MSCAGSVRSQLPLQDAGCQLKSIPLSAVFTLRRCISSANSPYQNPNSKNVARARGREVLGTPPECCINPTVSAFPPAISHSTNIEAFSVMEQCFNILNGQSAIPPHIPFASQSSPHVETLLGSMDLIYDHVPICLRDGFTTNAKNAIISSTMMGDGKVHSCPQIDPLQLGSAAVERDKLHISNHYWQVRIQSRWRPADCESRIWTLDSANRNMADIP
jgi:hypothetical protein